jgi:hypothetical protein
MPSMMNTLSDLVQRMQEHLAEYGDMPIEYNVVFTYDPQSTVHFTPGTDKFVIETRLTRDAYLQLIQNADAFYRGH